MGEELNLIERLKPQRGRDPRGESFATRFTKPELSVLSQAAAADGKTVREWARDVLLREAKHARADALFTEIVATRMLLNLVLKPLATGQKISADEFSGVLTTVRTTKHTAATDVMKQYASADQKER
jgi:hypothetical protein